MGLFSKMFLNVIHKDDCKYGTKMNYIFYKIIDFSRESEEYSIQCINTKAIFKQKTSGIILDIDILHGLHPIQACYIGLECERYMEEICRQYGTQESGKKKFLISRYGKYEICYQVRNGDVCFWDKTTKNEHIMDPRDICLSDEILSEFDASHAFYIGLYASVKRNVRSINASLAVTRKHPHLTVVKTE